MTSKHMDKNISIKDNTVTLRPMTEDDLLLKVQWYNDPEIRKTLIVDELFELEKTRCWFQSIQESDQRLDLVIQTNHQRPIGLINLVHIDSKNKTAEITLVIGDKSYWGKGVMYEAESLLINYAFKTLGLEKIWAQSRPENLASLVTMKKLGFQIEGTLRNHVLIGNTYSDVVQLGLLKEEFKSRHFR